MAFYGYLSTPWIKGPTIDVMKMTLSDGVIGIHLLTGTPKDIQLRTMMQFFVNLDKHWLWPMQFYGESERTELPGEVFISFQNGHGNRIQGQVEACLSHKSIDCLTEWTTEIYFPEWNKIPFLRWHEPILAFIPNQLEEEQRISLQRMLSMQSAFNNMSVHCVPRDDWPEGGKLFKTKPNET